MKRILLLLLIVCLVALPMAGCKIGEMTPEEKGKVSEISQTISTIEKENQDLEVKLKAYASGLVPSLMTATLESNRFTVSLLRQRIAALESGSKVTISAPATTPDPLLAASLEAEIAREFLELGKARSESERYSGGLIKATIDARAATHELTIASLRQKLLAAKYGLAIPFVSTGNPKEARKDAPQHAQKEQVSEKSTPIVQEELSPEEIEKLKADQEVVIESAYLYREGQYVNFYGITTVVKNNTKKVIKEYTVAMLGYDGEGFPLKINSSGVLKKGMSSNSNVQPNKTHGKGTYWRLSDMEATGVKTVLACVVTAEYYDGTIWENPYYKHWLEAYEDKPIVVATPKESTPNKENSSKSKPKI